MAAFQSVPLTEPTIVSDQRDPQARNAAATKPQVDPQLKWLEPEIAPFVVLLQNKRNQRPPIADFIHKWFKKYPYPHQVEIGGTGYDAVATALTLQAGDGAKLAPDFSLFNLRTEEMMRVVSVAGDIATVIRNIGSSGGVAILAGDQLLILGTTREDGAGIGQIRTTVVQEDYNLPEIERTPFGLTGRMLNTERWIGGDMEESQREAWHEHAKKLERKLFYGRRDQRTGTRGNGQNTMGGLLDFVRTNVWDLNGQQMTQTGFNDFATEVMKYGRGGYIGGSGAARKAMFCSRAVAQNITDWAGNNVRYKPNDTVVGMDVKEILSVSGVITLFPDALFDTVDALRNQAWIVDLNEVSLVPFRGRETRLMSDRQANDIDGREFEYFTDCSCEIPIQEAHGRILNIGL